MACAIRGFRQFSLPIGFLVFSVRVFPVVLTFWNHVIYKLVFRNPIYFLSTTVIPVALYKYWYVL